MSINDALKKALTVLCAVCLLAWNAVLGEAGSWILCLHAEGSVHLETAAGCEDCMPVDSEDCRSTEMLGAGKPDCVDLLLSGTGLLPVRFNELDPPMEVATLSPGWWNLPQHSRVNAIHPGSAWHNPGSPPRTSAILVARSVVRLL